MGVEQASSKTGVPPSVGPGQLNPTTNYDLGIKKAVKELFGKKIDWITGSGDNRSWSSFGAWVAGKGHDKQTGLENRTWGDWIAGRGSDHNNKATRTWSEFGTQFIPNWALGFSKKDSSEGTVDADASSCVSEHAGSFNISQADATAIGNHLVKQGTQHEAAKIQKSIEGKDNLSDYSVPGKIITEDNEGVVFEDDDNRDVSFSKIEDRHSTASNSSSDDDWQSVSSKEAKTWTASRDETE